MPIKYVVDEDRNFVYTKVTGAITPELLLAHTTRFLADPKIKPGFITLFDATTAQPQDMNQETLHEIMVVHSQHEQKLLNSKIALVVPDSAGFDFARGFERATIGTAIVFNNISVAKTWLGYKGDLV